MIDYQIGQVIRSRKVNYARPRIAAVALVGLAFAFGLSRTGTTTITTGPTMKPMNSCEVACGERGGVKVHAGGSGPVHVGS